MANRNTPRSKIDAGPLIDVTVVGGAGHAGLPLALAFAGEGLRVLIYDINAEALDMLRHGRLPAVEIGAEPLLERGLAHGQLLFSGDVRDIPGSGAIIVTIGTPVDEFSNPSIASVQECFDTLLPQLSDGQLIVLRSTVFPGTTDWIDEYLRRSGRTMKVAFCPERVVQGHALQEFRTMPQIVSGTTLEAEEAAAELFALISPELVRVRPIEAEFAKLFNNAYRYIQFAAANQFYTIADSAGVDYSNVLKAMTHNYPRANGFPSPGFAAGPCLYKDTVQLAAFAQNQFSLGQAAMSVNEGLPIYLVRQMEQRWDLHRMTVGLLGMAFKADVDDTRSSLSYKLKKLLAVRAKQVLTTDPFVTHDPSLLPLDEVIVRSDILVLCTPHACYRDLDLKGKPLVDVWGFHSPVRLLAEADV